MHRSPHRARLASRSAAFSLGLLLLAGCARRDGVAPPDAPPRELAIQSETSVGELEPRRFEASASRGFGGGLATIEYTLPHAGHVKVAVYDVAGRELGRVVDGWRPAGKHIADFNYGSGRRQVSLYRIEWEGQTLSGRVAAGP